MNKLTITVVVSVFNGSGTLQRCLDSIAAQTYADKELIIIDGGSTDGTVEILKSNTDKITYWQSEPDRGIYQAWNKAIPKVTGDWIVFLGSDDYLWNSEVFNNVAQKLLSIDASVRVAYGRVAIVSSANNILQISNNSWDKSKPDFKHYSNIHHQGVFHHRSLFEKYGLFDESFRIAGDYEFLLRELKNNDAHFLEEIISGAQIEGISSSPANYLKTYKEFYQARKKNQIDNLSTKLTWFYLKAYIRVFLSRTLGNKVANTIADLYRKATLRPFIWTKI